VSRTTGDWGIWVRAGDPNNGDGVLLLQRLFCHLLIFPLFGYFTMELINADELQLADRRTMLGS
jgi:hypothetical protein